ncbi:MOSC N-terminal beta barrel domain-containing protein [Micromonospora sp. WMMD998]|uniref:MOSC domain-containing protein n=1 Tax=Micromonospora sp. WMMD998 TaxID=3016092 RepID=UPI00249A44B0|nr:MOSC N-terminal beta barrel domain-containing protein [Micromonospora sp. WMMD998]WFE40291.1 MOSC domain-containing protein [Micromonospora sp. WMMD998]
MRLASVHLYPVKSLGGVDVDRAVVEPWGLRHDRRWVLLRPDGGALTARTAPGMLGLTAVPGGGSITLTDRDGASVTVAEPVDGPPAATAVSRLDTVRLAGDEAHAWLSARLGEPVRLGWLDDPRRRSVATDHGGRPGDPLNLADAGPLLVATVPSLRRLRDWIAEGARERGESAPGPLPMARFRPTVVLDGPAEPFAEDGWTRLRIGAVDLRVAERCDRCELTLIDPVTLTRGKEPIRTLARHRRRDGKTWFGIRLVPVTTGEIRVGDPVVAG